MEPVVEGGGSDGAEHVLGESAVPGHLFQPAADDRLWVAFIKRGREFMSVALSAQCQQHAGGNR